MTANENKKLDEELKDLLEDIPEEDLEKKIVRLINKRIRTIVLKVLLVAAVACTVLFFGISPIMNAAHYDPADEENKFEEVMRNYVELTTPWREVFPNTMQVESKGFGAYDVSLMVIDKTGSVIIGGNNVSFTIERGEITIKSDPELLMVKNASRFDLPYDMLTKAEVMELPSSAVLYLSLSLDEAVPLEVLRNLDVSVEWIQIDQPTVSFQGGLLMMASAGGNDRTRITMDDEQLLQSYCEHMKVLLDHPEMWRQFHLYDGRGAGYFPEFARSVLQVTYDDALTLDEIMVENFCVYGKRDQIATLFDQLSFDSIYVDNVRLIG